MYQEYLSFYSDPINEKNYQDTWIGFFEKIDSPTERLNHFVSEKENDNEDAWEIYNSIYSNFPLETVKDIIQSFLKSPYIYRDYMESVKLIYFYYYEYLESPPSEPIAQEIWSLINVVLDFAKCYPPDLPEDLSHLDLSMPYRCWHLLGFYPLIGNDGIENLVENSKLWLDDRQEMVFFSAYHYDPHVFWPYFQQILIYFHEHGNVSFTSATGMLFNLRLVYTKYKSLGINFEDDEQVNQILLDEHAWSYLRE